MPDVTTDNSYCTEAEAEAYFANRLYSSAWDNAEEADQQKALIMAAFLMEHHIAWFYEKTDEDQALQWPRTGFSDIDTNETPDTVKYAQLELALVLLQKDTTALSPSAGFDVLKFENFTVNFDSNTEITVIPDHIFSMVSNFGSRRDGTGIIKRIR